MKLFDRNKLDLGPGDFGLFAKLDQAAKITWPQLKDS